MFDLKFHKSVYDSIRTIDYIYKNPNLKQVLSNGGSIFDIIKSAGSRSIKRRNCKKNCTEEMNDYFRAFYFVYAIPHIEYFKVIK